ncbi:peptidoglycan editing factor PgeF [Synechococcus sp. RSCCF101]|uniref:peptidoglycan editing factor PgeF n=1 Tax=Synechococcus sp. RSCCF101 TaxID=2511069 RepID=UPI001244E75A|nr:peptidoglycan editing factor PgeF [Synechococcus sp. RSCCF101]QEY31364.1 peptidoglycan editing factor PgeF [Synechococcus sp. RSCCF101]
MSNREPIAPQRGPFDRPDSRFNTLAGWTWVSTYGGSFLQCDQLAAFEHGFFTRLWHGREPDELAGMISAGVSVHRVRQVHGPLVLAASTVRHPWPEADGLVSDGGAQSLWVCGADCTPVLLADPRSGRVAACHAGWRGVAGGILIEAVARLRDVGCDPSDLLVALGPAIDGRRYQVERTVTLAVAASLSDRPTAQPADPLQRLLDAGAVLEDAEPGRDRLDIRRVAALQLLDCGIPEERISHCPLCTARETELFHSWRRDGVRAVQWSGIVSQA